MQQELQQELQSGKDDLAKERAIAEQLVTAQAELAASTRSMQNENDAAVQESSELRGRNAELAAQV